jgi:parallel beta-helix repeat protein
MAMGKKTGYIIGLDKLFIDANDQPYNEVKPGDTLYFESGNRDYLLIKNFQGAPGKPIVMMNYNGVVVIDTDHYFGISIQNCRYLKLTGTGSPNQNYGFYIKRVANGAGLGIGDLSSDFEIEHISIENTSIAGIYAKTEPDCTLTSVRGTFTQYNTIIHDNYIANTGNEGLYVGSSKYDGISVQCDGKEVLLMPGLLDGVKIYNNTIRYSGWDGIQVSSASKNCQIYNNTVLFDSQSEIGSQMSGILIGGGSKCDCFNNFISQGKGNGIECHGLGGSRIFNNIIVDAGLSFDTTDNTHMKHGIFVSDVSIQNDSAFYIQHNDIINPKSDGIRFSSIKSKKNLIASNVIINPGNFDYYENGNTSFKGKDAYIMFQNLQTDATLNDNYLARNGENAGFSSLNMKSVDDFKLTANSPLIDNAIVDKQIKFDFSGIIRPQGAKSDIGAFEYEVMTSSIKPPNAPLNKIKLLQNPTKDYLIFSMPKEINSEVYLGIYSLNGKLLIQLKQWEISSENQTIMANISNIKSGIYIYSIRAGEFVSSGKFIKR